MARIKGLLVAAIATVLLEAIAVAGVKPPAAPSAPIPAQIVPAKKVFISYSGGEERWYEDPVFTGGLDRTYNEFYAAIKTWGRYELVGSPSEADLIFEIGLTAPAISGLASQGDSMARKPYDPQFRLAIRDAKTNTLLWAFTEHVQWAILQGNRDKNFELTLDKIVSDLQALVGQPVAMPTTANP
jgi:hypothetical protein